MQLDQLVPMFSPDRGFEFILFEYDVTTG